MQEFSHDLSAFLPFRDRAVCERVRAIPRSEIHKHPNANFRIRVVDPELHGTLYMLDIVAGIQRSLAEGRKRYVMILPAPMPRYALAAEMINQLRIPCHHVHTFNMDEYADEEGRTAPAGWRGGFQFSMWQNFFNRIDPALRMPESQVHFPLSDNIDVYSRMIEDLGGADVCYGGIGWSGHIAFFEPHLGHEFGNDIDAYLKAGSRIVDLHPLTICQNALSHGGLNSGDWSWHPPKAATIGPRELAGSKRISFWNGQSLTATTGWPRFIVRLASHGPVTPLVPSSILQILPSELTLSETVAADIDDRCGIITAPLIFPASPAAQERKPG